MRNIVVIVGSEHDLKQCAKGIATLRDYAERGQAKVTVHVKSVHRHNEKLHKLLVPLILKRESPIIIAGAGKAAHLPGCVDAYLRNELGDASIQVIGVAFTNGDEKDDRAAEFSITQVPGTQVLYAGSGADGFKKACFWACERQDFPTIKLAKIPPDLDLTLDQAFRMATEA